LHESQNLGGAGAGGKTPFGAGGRTPGHATPGRMSVRNVGKTPNPYGGPPRPAGAATPAYGAPPASNFGLPPQTPFSGYQTPSAAYTSGLPSAFPAGMNPDRAAMIQKSGGWESSGGSGWS
jgi:transcription elongation factor SPT6